MRIFLLCLLVCVIINVLMASVIYLVQLPSEDQPRDDQLDRIEEKLDTLIEIGEK